MQAKEQHKENASMKADIAIKKTVVKERLGTVETDRVSKVK